MGGAVIDVEFITYEKFCSMLQTYEGFLREFKSLRFSNPPWLPKAEPVWVFPNRRQHSRKYDNSLLSGNTVASRCELV